METSKYHACPNGCNVMIYGSKYEDGIHKCSTCNTPVINKTIITAVYCRECNIWRTENNVHGVCSKSGNNTFCYTRCIQG